MFVSLPHLSSSPTLMGNTEVGQGTEGWHPAALRLVWNYNDPKSWSPTEWSSMIPLVPKGERVIKTNKRKKKKQLTFIQSKPLRAAWKLGSILVGGSPVILIEFSSIPWGMMCFSVVGAGLALIKTQKLG